MSDEIPQYWCSCGGECKVVGFETQGLLRWPILECKVCKDQFEDDETTFEVNKMIRV